MKNIIIAPLFHNYMSGRIWMGLDIEKIKNTLSKQYNLEAKIIPFKNIVSELDTTEKGTILFYSSIYNREYLTFIKDTIKFISEIRPDIILIPNQDQLLSLENKGYQEYYKIKLGIERVIGRYYGDINDLFLDKNRMPFPFVLKLNEGALSSGVRLIKNKEELIDFYYQIKKRTLREKAAYFLNKRNSFKNDNNLNPIQNLLEMNFKDFFEKRKPVVTQEFIPNLECDYKILVFGEKYFVLQRMIRENDFRASGSGKFKWTQPPYKVLDYAKIIFKKMNVPFVSLDIGIDVDETCYLFEYQGVAFGPLTLTGSHKYFEFQNSEWIETKVISNLEENYAYAINKFLK